MALKNGNWYEISQTISSCIPRSNAGFRPAMIVELKYNQSAETAITQIKSTTHL